MKVIIRVWEVGRPERHALSCDWLAACQDRHDVMAVATWPWNQSAASGNTVAAFSIIDAFKERLKMRNSTYPRLLVADVPLMSQTLRGFKKDPWT